MLHREHGSHSHGRGKGSQIIETSSRKARSDGAKATGRATEAPRTAPRLYAVGVDGGKWLGIDVAAIRGLGVFCEDEEDELHRRHNAIRADLGYAIGNPFTHTWLWPRVGFDNLLVTFDRDNKPTASPFFTATMKHVLEKQIGLLILDTVTDLFGGNEIIRAQVNYFIKATCGGFY